MATRSKRRTKKHRHVGEAVFQMKVTVLRRSCAALIESPAAAAGRCLAEEMNVQTDLAQAGFLQYEVHDPVSGLVERERDRIFVGYFVGEPNSSARFVSDCVWVDSATLLEDLVANPTDYTPWLGRAPEWRWRVRVWIDGSSPLFDGGLASTPELDGTWRQHPLMDAEE